MRRPPCCSRSMLYIDSLMVQVLSRDSVTVTVDAVVYYRVSNPTMATNNVEDYGHSTHLLGATTLR
jgi:erythrocyte band 7 integral membrane protein